MAWELGLCRGQAGLPDLAVRVFHGDPRVAPLSPLGGQAAVGNGGSLSGVNGAVQVCSQGQDRGRCSVSRRAEVATLAGTLISLRRIVSVVARRVWVRPARRRLG